MDQYTGQPNHYLCKRASIGFDSETLNKATKPHDQAIQIMFNNEPRWFVKVIDWRSFLATLDPAWGQQIFLYVDDDDDLLTVKIYDDFVE